jgi:uncharacterized ion transporter superfamily protein YfcC
VSQPPNNPLKLASFIVYVLISIAILVYGVLDGGWLFIILGAAFVVISLIAIKTVRAGRNPWWVRSPFDSWWASHRR